MMHSIVLPFSSGLKTCVQVVITLLHLASSISETYQRMTAEFLSLVLPHRKHVPPTE